jgi:hypothetical protein
MIAILSVSDNRNETQALLVDRFHNIPHHSLDLRAALNRLNQVRVQLHQNGPDGGACCNCVHGVSLPKTVGVAGSEITQARKR